MGKKIGIEFIGPDEDAKKDVESVSDDFGKRSAPPGLGRNQDKQSIAKSSRMKKKVLPDFIQVTHRVPYHLSYISSPLDYENQNINYA